MANRFTQRLVAATLSLSLPLTGATVAHADTSPHLAVSDIGWHGDPSSIAAANASKPVSPVAPEQRAVPTGEGRAKVHTKDGNITAVIDKTKQVVVITEPDGKTLTVPAPVETTGIATYGGTTCSMLIWAADLVRMVGWEEAIAAVAATGPVGATVLVTMYAIGSSAFLAWVGSRCE